MKRYFRVIYRNYKFKSFVRFQLNRFPARLYKNRFDCRNHLATNDAICLPFICILSCTQSISANLLLVLRKVVGYVHTLVEYRDGTGKRPRWIPAVASRVPGRQAGTFRNTDRFGYICCYRKRKLASQEKVKSLKTSFTSSDLHIVFKWKHRNKRKCSYRLLLRVRDSIVVVIIFTTTPVGINNVYSV